MFEQTTMQGNFDHWKGRTRYRKAGKQMNPLTDRDFMEGMENGKFVIYNHKGFVALLYYSAVRKSEALRATREQFQVTRSDIVFSVGKRLKHGIETPPLKIPLAAPYVDALVKVIGDTSPGKAVFPYCKKTGYNIVARCFSYPHFFRLSRITNFFLEGWTIAQVHSWTGLTLKALDYYIGIVDIDKMGKSLYHGR
jgi:integrase